MRGGRNMETGEAPSPPKLRQDLRRDLHRGPISALLQLADWMGLSMAVVHPQPLINSPIAKLVELLGCLCILFWDD